MALSSSPSLLIILLLVSFSISSYAFNNHLIGHGGERRVGGRTEIVNVESNQEIQDLGRFCVHEYNLKFRSRSRGAPLLYFSRVVAAEKQVVSGFKYYLRITTAMDVGHRHLRITTAMDVGHRRRRMVFDAVVVVRPWMKDSRDLISFCPATGYWK